MPIAAYAIPQNGSFVAEPQYGGSHKWGGSYTAAPPYASYQQSADYSMYGSATPPLPYGHMYGHAYGSAPAYSYGSAPAYPQYAMPSAASFTYEQPAQHTYQMPTTASFTCDQPAQPHAAAQSFYAMPQQTSYAGYPQPANYQCMGDRCQFQFYPSAALGADESSKPTGPMNHSPARPEHAPARPEHNHMPADPSQATPAGPPARAKSPMPQAQAGPPGRAKSPMPKPNNSTSKRPPSQRPAKSKKKQGCCSCGV